jgi:hypothetical protein
VEVVRSNLFGKLDLYAANIERGREAGIPTVDEFRAYVSGHGSLIQQAGQASDYATAHPG